MGLTLKGENFTGDGIIDVYDELIDNRVSSAGARSSEHVVHLAALDHEKTTGYVDKHRLLDRNVKYIGIRTGPLCCDMTIHPQISQWFERETRIPINHGAWFVQSRSCFDHRSRYNLEFRAVASHKTDGILEG